MFSNFEDKKIAILGMSVEGYDSLRFFIEQKARITCCDQRQFKDLSIPQDLLNNPNIKWNTGSNYLDNLEDFDLLVKTAGMSPRLPKLLSAQNNGIKITSLSQIFLDHCKAPVIGITGTKGKGTTSSLIAHILKTSGKNVFLGGNIGSPLLSKVSKIKPSDWVVLELSSFQLEHLTTSPHIAVVLKITEDHLLNMDPLASNFHSTRADYLKAKMPIVSFQKKSDIAIFNGSDHDSTSFAKFTKAKTYFFGFDNDLDASIEKNAVWLNYNGNKQMVCELSQLNLRGKHNLENVAAASLTAITIGIPLKLITSSVKHFKPLEHRLEYVRKVDGITFYNDSFSTTPQTTIAALSSFIEPIVLIAGGSNKGLDYTKFADELLISNIRGVILIGQIAPQLKKIIIYTAKKNRKLVNFPMLTGSKNMDEIIAQSLSLAQSGDVVLLSPATASFGMFKNYKERGLQFKKYVEQIKTKKY